MNHVLQKHSPVRPLNWRQQRARVLVSGTGPYELAAEDAPTLAYARYLSRLREATLDDSEEFFDQLYWENPGIMYADVLHRHKDPMFPAMLEARVLANMSNTEIAAKLGTIPTTIRDYEAVFFNVRDRLDASDWIVRSITSPLAVATEGGRSFELRNREVSLKFFAYYGGPLALDLVAYGMQKRAFPTTRQDASDWFDQSYGELLRAKTTVGLREMDTNRYNIIQLLALYNEFSQRVKNEAGGPQTAYETHLEVLLNNVQWLPGPTAAKQGSARVAGVTESAYELRAADAQAALRGEKFQNVLKTGDSSSPQKQLVETSES